MNSLDDVKDYLSQFFNYSIYFSRTGSLVALDIVINYDELKIIVDSGFILHIFPEKDNKFSLDIDDQDTIHR